MKRLLFLAPLALAACTPPTSIPPAPSTVADKTTLDEQGMLAVELAYKAARMAVETGVDTGLVHGAAAARFASLDNTAYAALQAVRAAYRTGNATNYANALTQARSAITGLLALAGKGA